MILGLSHIAFSTCDIDAATRRLESFGYGQRFDEPALENHVSKVQMLSRFQPLHHIRALAVEGAMAIELLDHGGLPALQAAALVPIFRSEVAPAEWEYRPLDALPIAESGRATLRVTLGHEPRAFFDPALAMTLLWLPAEGQVPGLHACALPTNDIAATGTLLSQLRFRSDSLGLWSLLTPLPTLQARLIPVVAKPAEGWSEATFLDAPGCTCLALMARGVEAAPMLPALFSESVSFTLSVNGRVNKITLARPAHGPIIEMIDQPT